jgi:cytochrome bd ubiquinol oxidase subunit II
VGRAGPYRSAHHGHVCRSASGRRQLQDLAARYILPAIAVAGLAGVQFELRRRGELNAFLASATYLLGMLTSVVLGVYPMVLPARNAAYALTVASAKAGAYGLKIGLIWWVIGMILATIYFVRVYRSFAGKVGTETHGHGYGD